MTEPKNADVARKLLRARTHMLISMPFFGQLALRLRLVEDPSIPTLATNGRVIKYNPNFIDDLPPDQLRTAVAHEVGHCIFQHVGRRGARNPQRWNLAGDHVINLILEAEGMAAIPGYWNANPAYKGMSADQVYNLLPEGDGGDGNGESKGGQKALCEVMNGDGDGSEGNGDEGLGGMSESERVSMENDWKVATVQAAESSKQAGKLPGSFERFVESITQAKADWRDQLRQFFNERARDDYAWSRPNRRFLPKHILPGMYSETIGTVVVVTDDSGSIGNDVLSAFEAEIKDIRASSMPERTIHISCDARINAVQELAREDEFKIVSKGGGGTDFRPPFQWLDKHGIEPAVLVYLTDLYGPAPDADPGYPVIWCCTNEQQGPFGTTIHIDV